MDKVENKQSFEHEDNMIDSKEESMANDEYVPDTEEEKKLVRKIDLYILPMMWFMYLMSYMDRTKSPEWTRTSTSIPTDILLSLSSSLLATLSSKFPPT
ncbi:hypothetical protein LB505_012120 [Fusarium chuoi]|nr:hypothetical protein LB505_012120 [Fusarium chuoi]